MHFKNVPPESFSGNLNMTGPISVLFSCGWCLVVAKARSYQQEGSCCYQLALSDWLILHVAERTFVQSSSRIILMGPPLSKCPFAVTQMECEKNPMNMWNHVVCQANMYPAQPSEPLQANVLSVYPIPLCLKSVLVNNELVHSYLYFFSEEKRRVWVWGL